MKGCAERGAKRMRVHILLDGRDVAPGSAPKYIDILEKDLAAIRIMGCDAMIASGGGRMAVTMDRYEVSIDTSIPILIILCAAGRS
jgi:2,3-bisphosphoglycerate-independent phosphoglycerate mutase